MASERFALHQVKLIASSVVGSGAEKYSAFQIVHSGKVLLTPLHIKIGLMKNFLKVMVKTKLAFKYPLEKFPRLSEAKIKDGVFVSPQIRQLVRNYEFHHVLGGREMLTW